MQRNAYTYDAYDYSGERTLKLTGSNTLLDVNANFMLTTNSLDDLTLYPSPYIVVTDKGYTKHYYVGSDRLCARIGGGGLSGASQSAGLTNRAYGLFQLCANASTSRVLQGIDPQCVHNAVWDNDILRIPIIGAPQRLITTSTFDLSAFELKIKDHTLIVEQEDEAYFYHGDHSGGANWITDASGLPVQHLQYLPYGERYVDQHTSGSTYSEPFTFTGKEKDAETGFSYYGARYYDSDLSGLFLSVDPMADKYPNISPYAYCAWNPLKLVDPDGNEFSDIMEKYAKNIEAICQSKIDKLTELSKHEKLTEKQQDMLKEFQDTKNEIAAMRDDKTTFYDVQIASFGVGHENDKGITQYYGRGDITRKGKKQHLMMVSLNADKFSLTQKGELSYGGMLTLIHELKHCYQFYNKELFYLQPANGGDIITCDSEDIEKAAFKRGAAFGSVDRYNPALYKNHSKTMSKMIDDNPGCTIIKHK